MTLSPFSPQTRKRPRTVTPSSLTCLLYFSWLCDLLHISPMRGVPNGLGFGSRPQQLRKQPPSRWENPLDKGSSRVQQLIILSSVSPSSATVLMGTGVVFQQFYDNLLHLSACKAFRKVSFNFCNGNHKLRVTRLYTWRFGGHNMLDFSGVSTLSLLASLSFCACDSEGYSPQIPYKRGSPLVLLG